MCDESKEKNFSRNKRLYVRLTENEYKIVQAKFELSGDKNLSDFIRQALMSCYVIKLKDEKFENMVEESNRLLRNLTGNTNQIAIAANRSGNVYHEDLDELRKGVNELWQQQKSILSILQKVGL